jgi:hypothetical protein
MVERPLEPFLEEAGYGGHDGMVVANRAAR